MDIDSFLEKENDISLTTSDLDVVPVAARPPAGKPKPSKPAFAGLKPSAPPKTKHVEEVDEQAFYYTVSLTGVLSNPCSCADLAMAVP